MILGNETLRKIADLLKEKKETIAVAESTTGGLISAGLLAVPGASAYYLGGTVIYTRASRKVFLDVSLDQVSDLEPMSEEMALFFATAVRKKLRSTWGLAELGIAGPSGTPYGYEAGNSVIAVSGPVEDAIRVETGHNDRERNMTEFAQAACDLLKKTLLSPRDIEPEDPTVSEQDFEDEYL